MAGTTIMRLRFRGQIGSPAVYTYSINSGPKEMSK